MTTGRRTPSSTKSIVVDGITAWEFSTPVLTDERGNPISSERTVSVAMVVEPDGPPIHDTLSIYASSVGGGVFTVKFMPRALKLYLEPYAGLVVSLRVEPRGGAPVFVRCRVMWQLKRS